ncbi:MAG: DNA polymerase III subunit alpha [Planctomycetota bacterium]|nr:MAG: DNA polymerase III subunit alpha [Planctomycetota bacterium]
MVSISPFTHLHVHSHYSLLDGAITVPDLVGQASRCDMGALALTDHGNLFGAIEFYKIAREAGVRPILGCEAYVVDGDATKRPQPGEKRRRYHVTLLAKDRTGFSNLSKLSSRSWLEGFQRKPCIDLSMLAQNSEGLMALTGCMSGRVARPLLENRLDDAVRAAEEYAEILGRDNVYLEVMSNGLEPQRVIREAMPRVASATGLPLVATNDVHYACEGDAVAQDALICIGTGQRMHDTERRFKIDTNELYFRTSEQMAALFGEDSEAYRSTGEIAQRCDIQLDLETMHLPRFDIPTDESAPAYMRRICEDGLARRYGEVTQAARDRFEREFAVIESMGFVDYFLIVWDLIKHARGQGISVGPGRGSAAGSIVAYALEITQLCPLKYDLLFERFLNADRISMPDIDIDFCRDRREEVIEYTRQKYGNAQVCQIVTFGTMAAKAAIRDAGRVLDIPLADVDRIAKRIPDAPGTRLSKTLDDDKELMETLKSDERLSELADVSRRIEGMARNTSTHAAGVVITEHPLVEHVPLCVVKGAINTQFQMTALEDIGLLKMDFLGLKNLTILQKAARIVKLTCGEEIDYETLSLDDRATYELLKTGDTYGVFQLESSGMRELIVRLAPDCFEDIIALIALYRPGPLQSGMTDSFVNRKHGVEPITYDHALMEPILKDTYGAMVYQEQVMLLAQALGKLSLNDADGLRKAMGKKKLKVMLQYKDQFLEGCQQNTVPKPNAEKIWDDMSQFAQYGFNKSHSAAYGLITFRTAYMRAHYPGEYMAAIMSCDAGDSDKLAEYVEASRRSGLPVEAPDINASMDDFTLDDGSIRMGLNAVKGVGNKAVAAVLAARERAGGRFADLSDVVDNIDGKAVNRLAFDALAKAGVFDTLHPNRLALIASSERLLKEAARTQADRAAGQASLFGGAATPAAPLRLSEVAQPTPRELYELEKESLGFAVTADPMAEHRGLLRLLATHDVTQLAEVNDRAEVLVGGMIAGLRTTTSSRGRNAGKPMAMFKIQGLGGGCAAVLFSGPYAKYREHAHDEFIGLFRGRVDRTRDEPSLLIDEVLLLDDPELAAGRKLLIEVRAADEQALGSGLSDLAQALSAHGGPTETFLSVCLAGQARSNWRLPRGQRVAVVPTLLAALDQVLGPDAYRLR